VFGVKLRTETAFARRYVFTYETKGACLLRALGDLSEQGGLNAAANDAAGEEQGIDPADTAFGLRQRQTHDACVAEAIAYAHGNCLTARRGREAFDVGRGVSPRGEVELIGLGQQLHGSRQRSVRDR
jgi:hypothetical protein